MAQEVSKPTTQTSTDLAQHQETQQIVLQDVTNTGRSASTTIS